MNMLQQALIPYMYLGLSQWLLNASLFKIEKDH